MRVNHLAVKSLFDTFNHDIPLKLDDRITIIHGQNGFGKTVLLKLLDDFFNSRYGGFRRIPFREFKIGFDNAAEIVILKEKQNSIPRLTYKSKELGELHHELRTISKNEIRFPLSLFEDLVPQLQRVGPERWHHVNSGEIIGIEQIIERYGSNFPDEFSSVKVEPKWLKDLKKAITTRFIPAQRLLTRTELSSTTRVYSKRVYERYETGMIPESSIPAVTKYSNELASLIQSKLAESAALSQSLDRTFPHRLVDEISKGDLTNPSREELLSQLADLENNRTRLNLAGLLDQEEDNVQVPQQIDERTQSVLSIYVRDVQQKLSVFDELLNKIELLEQIINERFRYKEMIVSKDNGFTFRTTTKKARGKLISPDDLSSGEQHEVVLFYELLFKVQPSSLILLDEPELSLHILWQQQFLPDLQKVTKVAGFDVLIATHSPQIINDRWDLTVELEGPKA